VHSRFLAAQGWGLRDLEKRYGCLDLEDFLKPEHWQSDPHIGLAKLPNGTKFVLRLPNEEELLCELSGNREGQPLTAKRVLTGSLIFLGQKKKSMWRLK
jgi:hypothetical protein